MEQEAMWAVRTSEGTFIKNHTGLNTGKAIQVNGIKLFGFYTEDAASSLATIIDGTTESVFPSKWWEEKE